MSADKKCVWYISKYAAPPGPGAAGTRGFMLMKELARLGHRSVIVGSDSNNLGQIPVPESHYEHRSIDGVDVWVVRTMRYGVAKSARRILSWLHFEWRLFRMPKADLPVPDAVIASSLSLLTILNGFFLRRRYRCRLVFEVRDIWPLTIVQEGGFSRYNPVILILAWIERVGYQYADVIVGTMPNLHEHVVDVLGYDRPVFCVPMGIDCVDPLPQLVVPEEYVSKFIPLDKFIVAHAGTIGITNALESFLECATLCVQDSRVHFLILGEGDLKEGYIQKFGSLPNVTFAPRVDKQMVQSVLSRCDLLYFSVHDSLVWRFGQSLNKVVDYMMSGRPIVASYSGYPSMVNEAGCGTFVPSGDVEALRAEIVRYSQMTEYDRESVGARGRDWLLQNRCYETLANNYVEVIFN